jgi:hypothetical protein
MWQSFLPEAGAALAVADIDPLIALLRQIEAHAAVPEALRDQAATVLREYAAISNMPITTWWHCLFL